MFHTAYTTMTFFHELFEGMVISRRGDVNWPPRSCDLTELNIFLRGFQMLQVHANKQQSTLKVKFSRISAAGSLTVFY